jgi:hypothetical protein
MPSAADLPVDIRGLVDSTFFHLEYGKFPADAEHLIRLLREKSTVDPSVFRRKLAGSMRGVGGSYAVFAGAIDRLGPRLALAAAFLLLGAVALASHLLAYNFFSRSAFATGVQTGQADVVARYEERARARMLEIFKFKGVVTDGSSGIQGAEVVVENPKSGARTRPVRSVNGGRYNVDLGELLTSDEELVRLSVTMPGYREFVDEFTLKAGFEYRSVLVRAPGSVAGLEGGQ